MHFYVYAFMQNNRHFVMQNDEWFWYYKRVHFDEKALKVCDQNVFILWSGR